MYLFFFYNFNSKKCWGTWKKYLVSLICPPISSKYHKWISNFYQQVIKLMHVIAIWYFLRTSGSFWYSSSSYLSSPLNALLPTSVWLAWIVCPYPPAADSACLGLQLIQHICTTVFKCLQVCYRLLNVLSTSRNLEQGLQKTTIKMLVVLAHSEMSHTQSTVLTSPF